ncbi:hypothetical protein PROFUN_12860 [Planoprotostelium fungivorum]|uniref:GATA-type domain-containing protein n=1 Tax=Planoprotostelium fungivorum TaxID=1890364 RepID=A0A2P6N6A8_9EUKA|nr:hypothetical protein PROFUN_12860 [Planoprotostelium fungivorum]
MKKEQETTEDEHEPTTESEDPDTLITEAETIMGSYLLAHLKTYCENCGVTETPQWRKGWHSEIFHRPVALCNACGIKFSKQQYCGYCHYIYGKEQEKLHRIEQDEWLSCTTCNRWTHSECEATCGSKELARDPLTYRCLDCRQEETNKDKCMFKHIDKLYRHEERTTSEVPPSA